MTLEFLFGVVRHLFQGNTLYVQQVFRERILVSYQSDYRSLWALRKRNPKKLSKRGFCGVGKKKVPEKTGKGQKILQNLNSSG